MEMKVRHITPNEVIKLGNYRTNGLQTTIIIRSMLPEIMEVVNVKRGKIISWTERSGGAVFSTLKVQSKILGRKLQLGDKINLFPEDFGKWRRTLVIREKWINITSIKRHRKPNLIGDRYDIYTDGACSGNPGPMGMGLVILKNDELEFELSEYLGEGTNNIAELTAIKAGLLKTIIIAGSIRVHTDSEYCIGILTKNWKPKTNIELIKSIKDIRISKLRLQIEN